MHSFSLTNRSDAELLSGVKELAGQEREATAWLVAHLAEIDARQLYLAEGCSCLFRYCAEVLHLSESAAYRRIHAARVARQFPVVFQMLHEGSIHLTTISVLGPCLTAENHRELLQAGRSKKKDDLLLLAASVRPKPDVPSTIRKLPVREEGLSRVRQQLEPGLLALESATRTASNAAAPKEESSKSDEPTGGEVHTVPSRTAPPRKTVVAPLSPERYRIQFTASAKATQKLRQLQDLLRHQIPNGDPAVIFEQAIDLFHEHVMREKLAQVKRPRMRDSKTAEKKRPQGSSPSRHIPAEVKRAVWARDGGQCAFVSRGGRRCSEMGRLEFHHLEPYGWGGAATIDNIALRCRAHNAYEGEQVFGPVVSGRGLAPALVDREKRVARASAS